MPHSIVKNERDERLWKEAKRLAEKQGKGGRWAYVMEIYQGLKKG